MDNFFYSDGILEAETQDGDPSKRKYEASWKTLPMKLQFKKTMYFLLSSVILS